MVLHRAGDFRTNDVADADDSDRQWHPQPKQGRQLSLVSIGEPTQIGCGLDEEDIAMTRHICQSPPIRKCSTNRLPSKLRNTTRSGFTLVEVLLALSLCAFVVSAAFGAIHLSWKYRTAGETQVANALLVRGVLHDLTLDLRTAVLPTQTGAIEASSTSSEMPSALMQAIKELDAPPQLQTQLQLQDVANVREQLLEWDDVDQLQPVHFYGNASCFLMLSAVENHRFQSPTSSITDRAIQSRSPQSHVIWWWNEGRNTRLPFSVNNQRLIERSLVGSSHAEGLVRVRLAFDVLAQRSFAGTRRDPINHDTGEWITVLSDVESLKFRYSDGDRWWESWNSESSGQLPTAVECLLVRKRSRDKQRLVVRLPQVAVDQHRTSSNTQWVGQ